jgi:hypothetical protein
MTMKMWRWFLGILTVVNIALYIVIPATGQAPAPNGSPVRGIPQNYATKNSSVTIAAGNTFQQALASTIGTSTFRYSLTVQNNNTGSDNCYLFIGPAASATKAASILLATGGGSYSRYWPFVPSDAIQVTCDNTSDTVYVDTQ